MNHEPGSKSVTDDATEIEVEGSASGKVSLPYVGPAYERASPETLSAFEGVSAATAAATLHKMGITRAFMQGPRALGPEAKVVGSALTLAFMPKREDVAAARGQEQFEKRTALWAVLDEVRPFDVLVVQAFGDPFTGCLGEMLIHYLSTRGGLGVVVDGCIRDWPRIREMGVPVWATGVTPHFATQAGLLPWAYQVPVACGGVLVLPGDVVVADGDGAVVVPAQLALETARIASAHEEWEVFSRERLDGGGALAKYYPLDEEATAEYEVWRRDRS
jgi:regulator of RNase E activity RraA